MVLRELVTKLSFNFDRSNLDKFENSLVGFKTKFAIAAAGIGAITKAVIDFGSSFSKSVVFAQDLANYSGVALKDFLALRTAVGKFSIDESDFNTFFKNITIGINEASKGVDSFVRQLSDRSRGMVNFKTINGELTDTKDLILQIGQRIRALPDIRDQLRILENIPGITAENAGRFLEFFSQSTEEINKQIKAQEKSAQLIVDSVAQAKLYQSQVASLSTEWGKLYNTIGSFLAPKIGSLLGELNNAIDVSKNHSLSEVIHNASVEGEGPLGRSFKDLSNYLQGNQSFSDLQREEVEKEIDFQRRVVENYGNRSNANNVTINNRIDVSVPPGTGEGQATAIAEQIKIAIDDSWDQKTREVFNNSPQVE